MSVYPEDGQVPKKIIFKARSLTSKFKVKDLKDLNVTERSYLSPLSVIGHVDMNAFFAQVEQFKHGFHKDDPILCVQWSSIIAVNYPARKFGISRMDNIKSAVKKCPYIIPLHTAVFRKGENFWRNVNTSNYLDFPSPIDHKVSLDPYRRESRKILRIIKQHFKSVEKASVDECFFDVGPEVYQEIVKHFPVVNEKINDSQHGNCDNDYLPCLTEEMLSVFNGKVFGHFPEKIVNTDAKQKRDDDDVDVMTVHDWDDVVSLFASMLCLNVRKSIESYLGYSTSGGIGRTKTIAKLASGYKKPNNHTIIRNCNIDNFLNKFELTDFWGLGGKIGEQILTKLDIPIPNSKANIIPFSNMKIRESYTNSELLAILGSQELANKTYELVRGDYRQELLLNRPIPSMCSSKRFRGESVNRREDCVEWLKVFSGDLYQRIKEINEEESKPRSPRLISLQYSPLSTRIAKSKQMPFPQVTPASSNSSNDTLEKTIFEYSLILLDDVLKNEAPRYIGASQSDAFFPLGLMSLTVSKFEYTQNLIDNFFSGNSGASNDATRNIINVKKDKILDKTIDKFDKTENTRNFVYESRKKKPELKKEDNTRNIENLLKMSKRRKSTDGSEATSDDLRTDNESIKITTIKNDDKEDIKINDLLNMSNSLKDRPQLKTEEIDYDDDDGQINSEKYYCPECKRFIKFEDDDGSDDTTATKKNFQFLVNEHKDFHFAINYSKQLNGESLTNNILSNTQDNSDLLNARPKTLKKEKFDVFQQLKMKTKESKKDSKKVESGTIIINENISCTETGMKGASKEDSILIVDEEEEEDIVIYNEVSLSQEVQENRKRHYFHVRKESNITNEDKKLKKGY